ncbi:MAG TPA: GGDEF domain-containing protein [Rhodanobacteraceae bacterium]|nr:GGDEF domain-containing protein [Rhodanobacteraceae bacterium]
MVVIYGQSLGKRIDVGEAPVLIGRADEADLNIPHRSVSRHHCQVFRSGHGYRLRDLGATNPTRHNDRPIPDNEVALVDGDHITVGESVLKFVSHASLEAEYHEEVYQLATKDALTDLCNRRHFGELLDKEISRALRHQRPLVLGIIDVDLFKPVNDRYGHIEGDGVLRRIAALMREHVRVEDIAARIGGEEFAIVFPETSLDAATRMAERLREAVAAAMFMMPGGHAQQITISTGLAALSASEASASLLLQAADTALYRAKAGGRNQVCLYS